MRKTAIILLFGIVTLALVGLCIVQHQQIQRLSARRASPEPVVKPTATATIESAGIVAEKPRGQQERPIAAAQRNDGEVVPRIHPRLAEAATPIASKTAGAVCVQGRGFLDAQPT